MAKIRLTNAERLRWLRARGYDVGQPAAKRCRVCGYDRVHRWQGQCPCAWCGANNREGVRHG